MAKNYVQPGDQLDLTAPTGGVTTGVGALIGRLFAVALQTAAVSIGFVGRTKDVWSLAKVSTEVWVVGDIIYWDNANARTSNVATAGFRRVGVAVAAAANPSSTGNVRLDYSVGPIQGDAAPAPASISTAGAATYTAAQLIGGVIVRDPNGASRSDTLPTAALLVAAIPGAKVGDIIKTKVVNGADAAEVITILIGAGGAFDANQTASSQVIGQNTTKELVVRLTNVTASSEAYVAYL